MPAKTRLKQKAAKNLDSNKRQQKPDSNKRQQKNRTDCYFSSSKPKRVDI
jgi:hypothetical protein